jgi:rhamnosyltransferase
MMDVVDTLVRCRDEMPRVGACLEALAVQRSPRARVLFVDNGSSDGSREIADGMGLRILDVAPGRYVPGAVLNDAMACTESDIVVFVNADAVPMHDDALTRLVEPLLADPSVCASYGRQVATREATEQTRRDYERTFGAEPVPLRVGRFFSMAASAIRRDAWELLPFDATLRYSEDVDWTHRAGALGWRVAYVPEARFEKSREYGVLAHFRRRRGEGAADTRIHHLASPSPWRDLARPLAGSIARDARAGPSSARGVAVRVSQAAGYWAGRRFGWP